MTSTLDPSFLTALMLMHSFKHRPMMRAEAALLHLALTGTEFTAADLPGEVLTDDDGKKSTHIAGAATGALISQGLLIVVRRIKSPRPEAKGRKLDVLRLAPGKRSTADTWLRRNELPTPADLAVMQAAVDGAEGEQQTFL